MRCTRAAVGQTLKPGLRFNQGCGVINKANWRTQYMMGRGIEGRAC